MPLKQLLRLARGVIVGSWVAVLACTSSVGAETPAANPLIGLPSPPGAHVARLQGLAPGQWLDLGRPAPDPRWGRARGRSWTTNMAYAASLEVAFLFGEGVHGKVDGRTGRYLDDFWAYDLMAHRWLNLHPGTDTRNPPQLTVNPDGFVADAQGHPVPIATMVHGYEMTAWDPVRRQFMSMPNHHPYFKTALPTVAQFLSENEKRINTKAASPWIFSADSATWQRQRTLTPSPRSGFGATLLYVSSRDALFFNRGASVWFYDIAANTWQRRSPGGPKPPSGSEAVACYDPHRDRIYRGGGGYPNAPGPNALWIYDLKTDRWIDPAPAGYPVGTSYGTNSAMLHCDLANDRVLLVRHQGTDRGVFAYDPDGNVWHKRGALPRTWSEGWATNGSSGFYAETLGVHLFHVAGDSVANGRFLAYRLAR